MSADTETKVLTGYQVAKLANASLKRHGLDEIRPQMVYRYISQKLIKPVIETEDGIRVSEEVALAWVDKFVGNRVRRANEAETVESTPETEEDGELVNAE
jgi:hypothetical protein